MTGAEQVHKTNFPIIYLKNNVQVDGHALGVIKDLKTKVAEQMKMFQDVLKIRSANMRSQDSRRGQYSAAPAPSAGFGMRHRPGRKIFVSYFLIWLSNFEPRWHRKKCMLRRLPHKLSSIKSNRKHCW
jgi:hypothetical protein